MKWIVIVLLFAVAYAQDLSDADQYSDLYRSRREADPQGISLEAMKPLSGPDRRPSLDLNYNQPIYDKNGANANAYGGLNIRPGQAASPHLGVNFGKDYRNGQLGGFVQGQRGPGGRISPSAGIQGSWRFRRDVDELLDLGEEEKPRSRREADPQGSISVEGKKPLSGPDRRPSLDVNYNQRVYDRNGATANAYGGLNVRPGQAASPHLGVNFGKDYRNGQLGGFVQGQRGPGGRISPSAGIQGSWRFRRDADELLDLGEEEKLRSRRQADTGLVAKDLGGSEKDPSVSIGWNQRVIEKDGLTGDIYGGARVTSGKTPSPEFGATLRKDFDNGHVGGFARADKNPLGSFSPSYGVGGSYKTDNGWRTDLNAGQRHDPWGKSQSVGAGFGKEFNNGNGYVGVNTGAQRTPFGGWERSYGAGLRLNF